MDEYRCRQTDIRSNILLSQPLKPESRVQKTEQERTRKGNGRRTVEDREEISMWSNMSVVLVWGGLFVPNVSTVYKPKCVLQARFRYIQTFMC